MTTNPLQAKYARRLLKALGHLEYSFNKAQKLPTGGSLTDDQLETWESFASRLARTTDLFLTKFLKSKVLSEDPGFDGSLRDLCNFAEKKNWITNVDAWMGLRELRNATVHDYEEDDLERFHIRLLNETPRILQIKSWIQSA